MVINYPEDFSCYSFFNDMSNERINKIINDLIERLKENPRMSMAMKNCENTGIMVIKRKDRESKETSFKIIVMKNHWEKIIPLEDIMSEKD